MYLAQDHVCANLDRCEAYIGERVHKMETSVLTRLWQLAVAIPPLACTSWDAQ
jgi:hypothetical protein